MSLTVSSRPVTRRADTRRATSSVAVVGLGYVGLPTALAFAAEGVDVIGVDISPDRVADIRSGAVDLLDTDRVRLDGALASPGFRLTTTAAEVAEADTVLVCVPTPVDRSLAPDLTALRAACAAVVANARPGQTIVLTSTTYVGTTRDLLVDPLSARGLRVGDDVFVAFAPERIDPGNTVFRQELTPRVVGGTTPECAERAAAALGLIAPAIHTVGSTEAAEMSKLLENSFRAVNIALVNEFADAARELHVDVTEVIDAAATKPYGFMPFRPGPGVGGHCIPCDPHYLLWQLRGRRHRAPVMDAAMTAIATRPRHVVDRAREILADHGRPIAGARVLVVGVSYKPGVADVRESPALEIIDELAALHADVAYVDALVDTVVVDGQLVHSTASAWAQEWDLVVVHTGHPDLDAGWLGRQRAVLDATYRLPAAANRDVP